jgi:hypothetical protein
MQGEAHGAAEDTGNSDGHSILGFALTDPVAFRSEGRPGRQ